MNAHSLYSTVYLGPLTYYTRAIREGILHWEAQERFPKQTYRNRTYINGPNGLQMLTIPVSYEKTTLITQVEISYAEDWVKNHLKAIETAYGNAPFFDTVFAELSQILESRPQYLWDLNLAIHQWISGCLRTELPVEPTTAFTLPTIEPFTESDFRYCISPKKKDPLAEMLKPYPQPFTREFAPNVSILDLLFMEGSWGLDYLEKNWPHSEVIDG